MCGVVFGLPSFLCRQKIIESEKDKKKKSKDKLNHDQWEHDQKQAEVRQKVEKVQAFDDAIASMLEQQSMGEGVKKGAAGALFKRLDVDKECATQRLAPILSSCTRAVLCAGPFFVVVRTVWVPSLRVAVRCTARDVCRA